MATSKSRYDSRIPTRYCFVPLNKFRAVDLLVGSIVFKGSCYCLWSFEHPLSFISLRIAISSSIWQRPLLNQLSYSELPFVDPIYPIGQVFT